MEGAAARRAYKFLSSGGIGLFSGFAWPLPAGDRPGPWVEARGELAVCGNGIHACRTEDLPYWIDDELWVVELAEPIRDEERGLVARGGRLLDRIDNWDARAAFALARACAERASSCAAQALTGEGLTALADGIVRADSLDELRGELQEAFRALDGFAGRAAGYAADVVEYAIDSEREGADWAACAAYVDAYLAGFVATRGLTEQPDHEPAFFATRRAQSRWFVESLRLDGAL